MPAKRLKTKAGATAGAGARIAARPGEKFEIELPSNATTGYRWEIATAGPCLRLATHDRSAVTKAVGAAATERFVFEAVLEGTTTIEAVYKRPWESAALEKRVFHVKIHPGADKQRQ